MNTTPITFEELFDMNDSETAVMTAVIFPEDQDWEDAQNYFSDETGFAKDKNLIGCHRILGNVLGDDGRWDYLLVFDHPEIQFNPLARLRFHDIKWTSDFVVNYAEDYGHESN